MSLGHCDTCRYGPATEHCHGAGTYQVFDQDGLSTLLCQCYCAVQVRRRDAAEREVRRVVAEFRRSYGQDALDELLARVDAP